MRWEQVATQGRILRTIKSQKHGATVAEFAPQQGCHASLQSNLAPEFGQCLESQIPDLNNSNHQIGAKIGQMMRHLTGYSGCVAPSS